MNTEKYFIYIFFIFKKEVDMFRVDIGLYQHGS